MKTYFRLLSFARPFGNIVVPYAIFSFFSIIFSVINIALLIPLLNILFKVDTASKVTSLVRPEFHFNISYFLDLFKFYFNGVIESKGSEGALIFMMILLISASILKNLFKYLSSRIEGRTRARVVKNIRRKIFSRVLNLHTLFFTQQQRGDLVSRLTNDVQEVENSVVNTLTVVFREPATIVAYFITLFLMSAKLTVFSLILLPISGSIIAIISNSLRKQATIGQETLGALMGYIDETIIGMKVIKAFNSENFIKKGFSRINKKYADVITAMAYKRDLASPLSEVMGIMVVSGLLFYGGSLVLSKDSTLDASTFITFIAVFSQILSPAKSISSAFSNIQRGLASGVRIFAIIDTEAAIKNPAEPIKLRAFENGIKFENVGFSYNGIQQVLKDISFEIPKGKTIALVGPSGSGKSTLFDMIPRFIDPTEGKITIDGYDYKDLDKTNLRDYIGIVTQESILFNDTIFNNIAFGKDDARMEDVIKAAKVANAHDFILVTEKGYDTDIGDMGKNLSGGQRQRISIARAIFNNNPILILDEATSSLDTESEKLVQKALENLLKDRTSLIIAHRLSTVQHADVIIVIENGVILERGTHQELMSKESGLYKRLQLMQNE